MRKMILGFAILGTALSAVPAAAQDWGRGYDRGGYDRGYDRGFNRGGRADVFRQVEQVRFAVDRAIQRGTLSRSEVNYFRGEVRELNQLARRIGYNGVNRGEYAAIDRRADRVLAQLRQASRDGNRWDGRNYGNGYRNRF